MGYTPKRRSISSGQEKRGQPPQRHCSSLLSALTLGTIFHETDPVQKKGIVLEKGCFDSIDRHDRGDVVTSR